jgi:anti-anti-sigma factor
VVLDDAHIGRLEEWIVSTLDDRTSSSADTAWRESLEGFTLAKRPSSTRENTSTVPQETTGGWARFRLSHRRGIAVVSITDQALIKEEDLLELIGDVLALVEAGHRRVVLDFFAVERLSSWAANSINQAIRSCLASEGAVKFSGVRPEVATIFAMIGLDPRVALYPDSASAINGVWPDLPDLRPLPVSILTALMKAEDARPRKSAHPRGRGDEDHLAMTGARLIVLDGPSSGTPVTIRGTRFLIGRGPDCQLRLGSARVSRMHAAIERRDGRFFFRDLASTNGSLLNGRPFRDREVEIQDGDRITIGPLTFRLAIGPVVGRLDRFERSFGNGDRISSDFNEFPDTTEEFLSLGPVDGEIGLKYEVIEGVLVVTPLVSELDDEAAVDVIREALVSLNERRLPQRVVVNLSHLGHLSGRAIGMLVAHHLRLDRSGGALRVCLANPRVAVLLEQVKLGMLVDYHPTVDDAVISAWPQPVAATGRA